MTPLSRSVSLLAARISLAVLLLSFLLFGAWTAGGLPGQEEPSKKQPPPGKKKRVEEEEDAPRPKSKPKKVIRVEDEDDSKAKSAPSRPKEAAASGDLMQLAEQATHPALKTLFRNLAVPHDLVVFKRSRVTSSGQQRRDEDKIVPTPFYLGDGFGSHKRLSFTTLTDDFKPDKPLSPLPESVELVRPYEDIAGDQVRQFLRGGYDRREPEAPGYLSSSGMLAAAEQALSAVLRWHESAKQTGQRSGEGWPEVESKLRKQLLDDVRLEQMKVHTQAKDWKKVLELTRRLAVAYPNEAERQRIFRPVADMIQSALKDPTGSETKKQEACKRLHELEQEFPGNSAFAPLANLLRQRAKSFLDAAKELANEKDTPQNHQRIFDYLRQARETWPQLEGLRKFENEHGTDHPILRVGVRGLLPQYFSPAWACTENERRAVELLFESLVKRIPDQSGGFRYGPALAESRAQIVPLGRQFVLPRNAVWSDGRPLTAADIKFSLNLLQDGSGVGRSRVWGELLAAAESKKDPFQVTLRMKQGFLEPLALMTFKILPRDQRVNDEDFAKRPVSSGPFLLDAQRHSDEDNRECLFFIANPSYGVRPTKQNAPRIQEIRFYNYTNAVEELSGGKLDLLLDLTAQEAQELLEKQSRERLAVEVPLPSSRVPNRRIYFLAVNTRKLGNAKVRRAVAFAINREALLNKHFRASLKAPVHRPLNGPFPMGSWACNNKENADLHDAGRAKNLSLDPAVQAVKSATLKYPGGDAALNEAMKELSGQVKALTGIVLEPTPCDPYQLREDVEQTGNYDLAYYYYDYPDDSYWLTPLLGPPPRAVRNNINLFKFNNTGITNLLAAATSYRDFERVREYQWQTHVSLNEEMPFIPLWQLDPLLAYRREVEPAALDPLGVFDNIEEWYLKRK